jgi:hypothetical protein
MTGYKSGTKGRSERKRHIVALYIYCTVDHGTSTVGDSWIVMYEIIRGKPAHSSFQQSSLHTSSDAPAISHTFPTVKGKKDLRMCV